MVTLFSQAHFLCTHNVTASEGVAQRNTKLIRGTQHSPSVHVAALQVVPAGSLICTIEAVAQDTNEVQFGAVDVGWEGRENTTTTADTAGD